VDFGDLGNHEEIKTKSAFRSTVKAVQVKTIMMVDATVEQQLRQSTLYHKNSSAC